MILSLSFLLSPDDDGLGFVGIMLNITFGIAAAGNAEDCFDVTQSCNFFVFHLESVLCLFGIAAAGCRGWF